MEYLKIFLMKNRITKKIEKMQINLEILCTMFRNVTNEYPQSKGNLL